ncbi:MAG: hypothetical protein M3Y32_02455 [Pseudomonadota bacterium]|nr:hypothetical protein [Pseudomonadota bacterium]
MKPAPDRQAPVSLKRWISSGPDRRVLLVDSITQLEAADAGAVVITGSHGGRSAATYALALTLRLVIFNDAGRRQGPRRQRCTRTAAGRGLRRGCGSPHSARIGEARDAWEHGVLSHVNELAAARGLMPGQGVQAALQRASA